MKEAQLNSLALAAQSGDTNALWAIRARFSFEIERMLKLNWWKFDNEERFWNNCDTRIEEAIRKFDPKKGTLHFQVMWRVHGLLKQHIKRGKKQDVVFLHWRGDEVGSVGEAIEVEDDLAVIDDSYLVNEKIAFLAEGDSRKEMILKSWSDGFYNESELATLLTQRFGGNTESQRKFIRRFKKTCRKRLLVAA